MRASGETADEISDRPMTAQRWRLVLWAAMLALVLFLVWRARTALIPFALGALLAYTLTPVVDVVASMMPARVFTAVTAGAHQATVYRRGVAVLLVYIVIGIALFAVGSVIIPLAAEQTVQFVDDLPMFIEDARTQTSDWLTQYRERVPEDVQEEIDGYVRDAGAALADRVAGMAQGSVNLLTSTVGIVFGFLIVPFWMFYALRDRHNVARNFMNAVPEPVREDVSNLLAIADWVLLRYVRAQIILGIVVGTAVGVGLTLLDVPLSLALGIIAGVTELIPIIGPWIGAVPGMVLTAGTGDTQLLIKVGLLYLAVQQVENVLLVPRVQGHAVELHPAMIILLLVVAAAAFGFVGLVVIVPLTAIVREMFWYIDRRLSGTDAPRALALSHVGRERQPSRSLLARLLRRGNDREPTEERAAAVERPAEPGGGT